MEIKIHIEKKHLYYLIILICFGVIGLVIAQGVYDDKTFHQYLLVDYMKSKTDTNPVEIKDDLTITGDTTTPNLEYTESFKGKKTYRQYYVNRVNKHASKTIPLEDWDICFFTRYRLHDVEAGRDDSAAECVLWYDGATGADKVFESGDKPSWNLKANVDCADSCSGEKVDVYCRAICMNFG